jgi:TonB-dependent SusC/RagA subfamily outer membrane receptor
MTMANDPTDRLRFLPSVAAVLALLAFALTGCGRSMGSAWDTRPADRPTTGSIVTAAQIEADPSAVTVEDILQRHFSGMYVRRRNEPGGAATVHVLGLGQPLFIIDGVPVLRDGNIGLNPRDIETIEVRKHGGATAEYGLRGANGVVLIRTKGASAR